MTGNNNLKRRSKSKTKRRSKSRTKTKPSLSQLKRKYDLIVFDIDSTLFDSLDKDDGTVSIKADHKLVHGGDHFKMYARPYLENFIKFCQKNFKKIALWTHADKLWLKKFIDNILPNNTDLLFTYHSSHAEEVVIPKKGEVKLKPLSKIYAEFPEFNSSNTIIIEDTEDNCLKNLKNCIIVPEFSVKKHVDGEPDIVLPLLAKYLLKLQSGKVATIDRKGWYKKELKEFKISQKKF